MTRMWETRLGRFTVASYKVGLQFGVTLTFGRFPETGPTVCLTLYWWPKWALCLDWAWW